MKAILLAGGLGSRLFPATKNISKQLLPIYDKPMVYYPLSLLMLAEIRDVLIITSPEDKHSFVSMLGDGSYLGMRLEYAVQETPNGIAKAFEIGADFIGNSNVCLVLGDNLFYGHTLKPLMLQTKTVQHGATVFGYKVPDPERYGVVAFDQSCNAVSIEEKPIDPKSNFAVTGLYFYDQNVVSIAQQISPSARGEYEITSINQAYLQAGALRVELLGDDVSWFDAGTHESLLAATNFVADEQRDECKIIASLETIAFQNNWITRGDLLSLADSYPLSTYSQYLKEIALNEISVL
ncbi:glucose-1-phosphate thymidylyltransferase RfbA [Neptuniibacter pectenicola]|jgi:glucose-1-phosphate thymidylyltransferase|uniref:Glucose-1-phosphate thymidylyltransferase n=1 Tax=Neptuniibacter pectenicola TaxID=1806669 RepID=A0ABU9TSB2_9GAMM